MSADLTKVASKNVFWTMSGNIGVSVLRFITTAILARILVPEDFGIVGIALLFTGIVALFGKLGMAPALIQRKGINADYLATAFWASVVVGMVLTILSNLIAPAAAAFFKTSSVHFVISIVSFNFIFSGFGATHAATLSRDLRFKELAIIEIATTIVRIICILFLALKGYGYWAIIIGLLVDRILKTILIVIVAKWLPKCSFHYDKFKELFKFGRNIYGQSFLEYLNDNMDYIFIGRLLGTANLAYYQFSYNIPHLVLTHFSEAVNNVTFPLYSKVQDDKARVARGYLKAVNFTSMITFPIMLGLFFVAEDFIVVFYGKQWMASILPMKILCFSGALRSVFFINTSLLNSQGRPDIGFKWNLFMFPITIGALYLGATKGIIGIASMMFLLSLMFLFVVKFGLNLVNAKLEDYIKALGPATISAAVMLMVLMGVGEMFTSMNPVMRLLTNIVIGGGSYAITIFIFFRDQFNELKNFVGKILIK